MRRDNLFWGGVLILFGVLYLLQVQHVITNVFIYFWPLILILIGSWMVANVFWRPTPAVGETFSIALREAKSVSYRFNHGAAQIQIRGGASAGKALEGASAVGMNVHSDLVGDRLEVRVETGPSMIPFIGPSGGLWQYQITNEVPINLNIEAGASTFDVDLADVSASRIVLKVGASTVNLTLPAHGVSHLDIDGGAASFNLRVPDGTAARISSVDGFTAMTVDTERFPRLDSGLYQSPNFDSAPDRTEIDIRAGMGSVNVK